MARKALKLASWTSVALAASGGYLYSNKYLDPNDFGAVRVGRAVATVGFSHLGVAEELQYYLQVFQTCSRWVCWSCTSVFLPGPELHLHSSTDMDMHAHPPAFLYTHPVTVWFSTTALHEVSGLRSLHFRFCILFSHDSEGQCSLANATEGRFRGRKTAD